MRRREFMVGLGSLVMSPVASLAQQRAPVVSVVYGGSAEETIERVRVFSAALGKAGYVDGQNVTVEYHWLEGRYDRLSMLMADLVRRHVALIAMPANTPGAIAAKAATTTIPIVFGVARPRQARPCREPRTAGRQRDGHQFSYKRGCDKTARPFEKTRAQCSSHCRSCRSGQCFRH
jgi:ABC-type uncharacterized transport system substrate-binding protein